MDLPQKQLKFIFEKHKIEYIKKLGSGGFGSVYLGNSISQEFLPLAIKCITHKQLAKKPSLQKYLQQEINSMYSLRHPHIVKLLKTFVDAESIFLVMEYCEYGNLYSYQYGMPDKVFKYNEAIKIFVQILKGLKAIHQEKIIHRDLKCQNILLKKVPKQQTYTCKIGDFGFAKELSQTAKSHCGTPNFMAPEILAERPYDKCVDIWSIGVILFYMLFGDYPFKGLNLLNDIENKCAEGYDLLRQLHPQLIKKKNKSLSDKSLNTLRHFFSKIFVISPNQRMTIMQISRHPLFKDSMFTLEAESQSTQSSQSIEQQRMFNIKKVEFIEQVQNKILAKDVLKDDNVLILKYFFNKIALSVLVAAQKQADFHEQKMFKDLCSKKMERVMNQYKQLKSQLETIITNKGSFGIAFNMTCLNSSYQKFEFFKDIYRTFLGYVFSQVHSCPMKDKERLKIQVLCCHTINRVFQDSNAKYFSFFNNWASKKGKKGKGFFDFDLFLKWIEQDSQDNISKTISAINEHFYSKK